ncbi:MAG: Nif3-like dinuclear metal center hexameric protein [Candidatus Roizmanbacteria bacterium]|nr:Nif3-like dinuclear metal center hexameric protein [Candidatus Roizmanbacteria bacterium]
MVKRDEITSYINKLIGSDLLEKARVKDEMANGIQIEGALDVDVVTVGVSLNEEFLLKAIADRSNYCIFHHGFDPRTFKSIYSRSAQQRLKIIFQNSITVMGLHYALDAHPVIGNNAQIIEKLGAKIVKPLYEEWGFVAKFSKPQSVLELKSKCNELFNRDVYHVPGTEDEIHTIGVVSGAGKPHDPQLAELEREDVELYISGEASESSPHKLKESGIHYFICGHYSSEVFGVKALAEEIKKHFKERLVVEFIDVPNPL